MKVYRVLTAVLLTSLTTLAISGGPATARTPFAPCAVTGDTPPAAGAEQLAGDLSKRRPEATTGGANLDGLGTWEVPGGTRPVVLVDAPQPATVAVVLFGIRLPSSTARVDTPGRSVQVVDTAALRWTRHAGLSVTTGKCHDELLLSTGRPWYGTVFGLAGAALLLLGLIGAVLLGRGRRGGWLRRFLLAVPAALAAGVGEVLLLHESGAVSPFAAEPLAVPAAGLLLAALLPLTRRRGAVPILDQPLAAPATDQANPTGRSAPDPDRADAAEPSPAEPDAAGSPTIGPVSDPTDVSRSDADPPAAESHEVEPPAGPALLVPAAAQADPADDAGSASAGAPAEPSSPAVTAGRIVSAALVVVLALAAVVAPVVLRPATTSAAAAAAAASASAEIVTPAGALLVATSLWAEAKAGRTGQLTGAAKVFATGILDGVKGFRENPVSAFVVGVPPGQRAYPAHFVATADTPIDDGRTLHFFALLVRESAAKPWTMVEFRVAPSLDFVPRPDIRADGYLAAVPAVADLAIDPTSAGSRYIDWYNRSVQAKTVVADDALEFHSRSVVLEKHAGSAGATTDRLPVFRVYTATRATVRPELVPPRDGGVLVSLSVETHLEVFNSDRPVTRSCDVEWLTLDDEDPAHYRHTRYTATQFPIVSVPLRGKPGKSAVDDNVAGEWTGTGDPC